MAYIKQILKRVFLFFYKKNLKAKHNLKFGQHVYINRSNHFEGYNYLSDKSSLTSSHIGFASYLGENTKIKNAKIGKYTSIGPNVNCIFGNHPSHTFVSTHPAFFSLLAQAGFTFVNHQVFNEFPQPLNKNESFTINIGNDVWIGANVSILDGLTIGDGAIVAANSLVNKNVEPYTIVGGVPAKVIKKRFSNDEIDFLLEFQWWNNSKEWLAKHAEIFTDIDVFMKTFKNVQ